MEKNEFIKKFLKNNKNFSWMNYIKNNNLTIKNINNKESLYNYLYENNIMYLDKQISKKKQINFEIFLKNNSIKFVYISSSLKVFKNRILDKYNLEIYNPKKHLKETVIFFGLYNSNDLNLIINHNYKRYLMFGGTDVDSPFNNFLIKKINKQRLKLIFISISDNIYKRLKKRNIYSNLVYFNLVNNKIFYPMESKNKNNIYIYNGFKKGFEHRYGKVIYEEVIKKLPHYKYIFSNELNVEYNKMPHIYKNCFIGLRLTFKDGNANTVQEFEAMDIPIIHNQSEYGIKWNNTDDIVKIINNHYNKNIIQTVNKCDDELNKGIDFYNLTELSNSKIELININLNSFTKKIKKYKKILFICSDFPGYGGAATNCEALYNFFSNNHETKVLYHSKLLKLKKTKNIYYSDYKNLPIVLKDLEKWNPDLIILKNYFVINLKNNFKNSYIIYLIAGIYRDVLDKNYKELKNLEDNKKYINKNVLLQIKNSDESYCNSYHTKKILKDIFNIETNLLYSSLINYYNKPYNKTNIYDRKYNFGFIVSNFHRKIKNIDNTINFLKTKNKVILIGKYSTIYKKHGFECKDLISPDKMNYYYKDIKFIVQNSHFESCSNVKIESLYNGCRIINNFTKKILVCSTQYPGYGGAATNAYLIIKYLRKKGYNVCGLFFNDNLNVNYDPDLIGGVYLFSNKYTYFDRQFTNFNEKKYYSDYKLIKNKIIKFLKGDPDICLAKNYVAPYICKKIFNVKTIYLVSGIKYFKSNQYLTATEFLKNDYKILKTNNLSNYYENESLKLSDIIVCNSNLTKKIFLKLNPNYSNKLYDNVLNTSNILYNKSNILNKCIDIIFICSRMDRIQKNPELVKKIFEDKRLYKYKKIVIGNLSKKYFKNIYNCLCYDLLPQKECIKHLKNSKFLLIPSFFDSSPNVCFEAYYNKCIPIISKNIGGNENFPKDLVCENLKLEVWINKIIKLIETYKYSSNLINQIKYDDVLFEYLFY